MEPLPFGWLFAALFWGLLIGTIAVLAVPSLRSRRGMRWTVIGAFIALLAGSLIWTYTLGPVPA